MRVDVRVKFCGLRRRQDVQDALRLGVDFVGFVLVPGSRREVSVPAIEELSADLDWGVTRRVGVFRDCPAVAINAAVRRLRLDFVQLHGHEPRDAASAIDVPVIRAVRVRAGAPAAAAPTRVGREAVSIAPNTFALLVDSEDAHGDSGGLGTAVPDAARAGLIEQFEPGTRLFLAGGLTSATVASAALRFSPYAVDVSSGIETAPGVKDMERMRAFLGALGRLA